MATRKRPGYHPSIKNGSPQKDTFKERGFYQSRAWRQIREVALQRDHYLCQNCLRNNRLTRATEVHHIQPLEDHPELGLELANLQSLCWDCHEQTKDHGKRVVVVPSGVRVIKVTDDSDVDCM